MELTLWVQVVPKRATWHNSIYGAKRVKITRRKPKADAMLTDARLVQVTLNIPDDNFTAQAVEATVAPPTPIRAVS